MTASRALSPDPKHVKPGTCTPNLGSNKNKTGRLKPTPKTPEALDRDLEVKWFGEFLYNDRLLGFGGFEGFALQGPRLGYAP